MFFIKSFSLLAACLIGLFAEVHVGRSSVSFDDVGYVISRSSRTTNFLTGPIRETVYVKDLDITSDWKAGRSIRLSDRLKCRLSGSADRQESSNDGQEYFYQCRRKSFGLHKFLDLRDDK